MELSNPALVEDPKDITADWLNAALDSVGIGLVAASVSTEAVGTGQMGATYRLGVSWAGGDGPETLIAKVAAGDPTSRAMVSQGYAAEVGFYRHLSGRTTVSTPGCWYSAISDDATEFTLLLDDAAPAVPGVQVEGCTTEQAASALANLVGLHAPFWNDPALEGADYLMRTGPDGAAFLQELLIGATADFVERYREDLGSDEAEVLKTVADSIADWVVAAGEHSSLIHGDYRLDNLMFAPDGEVVALDWQTAGVGPALRDVAYFLGTCLDVEQRRQHEERLVADYHAGLLRSGVQDYDFELCWEDYRLGQLHGPLVTVLGAILATGTRSESSDAMFLAMAHRCCAAISDLGSFDLF